MLQEKIRVLTGDMSRQIREMQEQSNEADVEFKRLSAELQRQTEDFDLKENELEKLDISNQRIKECQYDRKIEALHRELTNVQKQRTEM